MKRAVFALLVCPICVTAQHRKLVLNLDTLEGRSLYVVDREQNPAAKLNGWNEFLKHYPKSDFAPVVMGQIVEFHMKASQYDKAIAAGERMLAQYPDEVEIAHTCLKAAEATKSPEAVMKWSRQVSQIARRIAAAPKPQDMEEADWIERKEYAKQADTYSEYSMYVAGLQAPNAQERMKLFDILEQQNPESQYLGAVYTYYYQTARQAGNVERAVTIAEKGLQKDPENDELLLAVADYHFQHKTNTEKALAYALKLTELARTKKKPEGLSDAEWNKKLTLMSVNGEYIAGMIYSTQQRYVLADKLLRQALPNLKGNDQMLAGTLFHLGIANFRLGLETDNVDRIREAYRYTQQCVAISSQFQAQAAKHIAAIEYQYNFK